MQYRKLGRSGLEVSAISLGCEGFIGMGEPEAKAMFATAIHAGVNFIDMYSSDPEMRSLVGRMLAPSQCTSQTKGCANTSLLLHTKEHD